MGCDGIPTALARQGVRMSKEMSPFQERLVLLLGGATLLSLSVRTRLPRWTGVILLGVSALVWRTSMDSLNSKALDY
jgi:hypothetical protein